MASSKLKRITPPPSSPKVGKNRAAKPSPAKPLAPTGRSITPPPPKRPRKPVAESQPEKEIHPDTPSHKTKGRYSLFKIELLAEFAAKYRSELIEHRRRAEARGTVCNLAWEQGLVQKWASEDAQRSRRETADGDKWGHFPSLIREYMYEPFGLGELLADGEISEIYIDGADHLRVKNRKGRIEKLDPIASTSEELLSMVKSWVTSFAASSQRFDSSAPYLNLTIPPYGDRMHIIGYLGHDPVNVTIRRHDFSITSLEALTRKGSIDPALGRFLKASVKAKLNILIAGATGSGKTTMLRCLISNCNPSESIVTIEDTPEIGLRKFAPHLWSRELYSREANIEGTGAVSMEDLIKEGLRMDPSRVIVGEVRSVEAMPMLLAMSQGTDGSIGTIHATSAEDAILRLQVYIQTFVSPPPDLEPIARLIRMGVHLIIFMARHDGIPKLHEIVAVDPYTMETNAPAVSKLVDWDHKEGCHVLTGNPIPSNIRERLLRCDWEDWEQISSREAEAAAADMM